MYSLRIVTRLRTLVLVMAALVTAGHPCVAALSIEGVCPMADCATPGRSIGSADCCCASPGDVADVKPVSAMTSAGPGAVFTSVVAAHPDLAAHAAPAAGIRVPDAVPLFLRNSTLLI
jgi:hypothetical protein